MENDTQIGGDHYRANTGICPHCRKEIQTWDLTGRMPFLVGNIVKYVVRHALKGKKEDLIKAKQCIDKLIEQEYFGDNQ